ncbi:uncharacterized protein EV422DRAFT_350568 [Fimicolochytrium jonesii]|uniref:uncharacterized protein n=1 Tax=Fimicolochytrium jonesii TaxID=1396493 RepID=UPI0022FDEA17|nr:uncharacterized protein EV422DRAFT_350568 [Fimicolochytrium jonesii]KAI8815646.1 hypothetical protein EV422DRAFT_350568 [Fimicolochytrium jonesii]
MIAFKKVFYMNLWRKLPDPQHRQITSFYRSMRSTVINTELMTLISHREQPIRMADGRDLALGPNVHIIATANPDTSLSLSAGSTFRWTVEQMNRFHYARTDKLDFPDAPAGNVNGFEDIHRKYNAWLNERPSVSRLRSWMDVDGTDLKQIFGPTDNGNNATLTGGQRSDTTTERIMFAHQTLSSLNLKTAFPFGYFVANAADVRLYVMSVLRTVQSHILPVLHRDKEHDESALKYKYVDAIETMEWLSRHLEEVLEIMLPNEQLASFAWEQHDEVAKAGALGTTILADDCVPSYHISGFSPETLSQFMTSGGQTLGGRIGSVQVLRRSVIFLLSIQERRIIGLVYAAGPTERDPESVAAIYPANPEYDRVHVPILVPFGRRLNVPLEPITDVSAETAIVSHLLFNSIKQ